MTSAPEGPERTSGNRHGARLLHISSVLLRVDFPCSPRVRIPSWPNLSRKLPVLDAVRLIGCCSETGAGVRFVGGVVAFKPNHTAFPFESQNVRRDAIEEPAIVGNDHGASGKVFQSLFKRP